MQGLSMIRFMLIGHTGDLAGSGLRILRLSQDSGRSRDTTRVVSNRTNPLTAGFSVECWRAQACNHLFTFLYDRPKASALSLPGQTGSSANDLSVPKQGHATRADAVHLKGSLKTCGPH